MAQARAPVPGAVVLAAEGHRPSRHRQRAVHYRRRGGHPWRRRQEWFDQLRGGVFSVFVFVCRLEPELVWFRRQAGDGGVDRYRFAARADFFSRLDAGDEDAERFVLDRVEPGPAFVADDDFGDDVEAAARQQRAFRVDGAVQDGRGRGQFGRRQGGRHRRGSIAGGEGFVEAFGPSGGVFGHDPPVIFGVGRQAAFEVGGNRHFQRHRFAARGQFPPPDFEVGEVFPGFPAVFDRPTGIEPFGIDREVQRRFVVAQRRRREVLDRRRRRGSRGRRQAGQPHQAEQSCADPSHR